MFGYQYRLRVVDRFIAFRLRNFRRNQPGPPDCDSYTMGCNRR